MKKIIYLSLIIIFGISTNSNSLAQVARSTTFDDRDMCEKYGGVWREFGNGCVDSCRAKLDRTTMCTMSLTYGCDCGENRCLDNGKCVKVSDYKQSFERAQEVENEEMENQKEVRKEDYRRVRNDMLNNLNKKIAEEKNDASANNGKQGSTDQQPNNNLSQFVKPSNNKPGSNFIVDTLTKPILNDRNKGEAATNNSETVSAKQKFKIPSFFLNNKNNNNNNSVKTEQESNNNSSDGKISSDEGIPKIPLPN